MAPADPVDGISPPRSDPDSEQWVQVLGGTGSRQQAGLARLHELLLRIGPSGRDVNYLRTSSCYLDSWL